MSLEVIPILFGKSEKIIAKRFGSNADEISLKLDLYMQTRSPPRCTHVRHGKIYVARHNGKYKRVMLKFTSVHTGLRNMTLLDEEGSLVQEGYSDVYPLWDETLSKEKFGILKIKIYELKIIDEAAAARTFNINAKDTPCQAILRSENLNPFVCW